MTYSPYDFVKLRCFCGKKFVKIKTNTFYKAKILPEVLVVEREFWRKTSAPRDLGELRKDAVLLSWFSLALGERVRVREDSERDAVPCKIFGALRKDAAPSSRFPLALWERVRVRE
jgi:hypothetical protein